MGANLLPPMGACEGEAAKWAISDSISTSPQHGLNYR